VFAETAENGVLVPADDVYAEYEYTEHDELGDGEYGEIPLIEGNLPEAMSIMCGHSETLELAGTGGATPRLSDLASDPEHTTGTESHRDSRNKELVRSLELQHEISNHQGPSEQEPSPAVSKPDVRFSASQIDEQANFDPDDVTSHPTDTNEEVEPWDNDPDGDDDPDAAWEIDEDETESNQSSVTLSSKMSSKRSISEVEQEQKHDHTPSFPASPGAKRPRIE